MGKEEYPSTRRLMYSLQSSSVGSRRRLYVHCTIWIAPGHHAWYPFTAEVTAEVTEIEHIWIMKIIAIQIHALIEAHPQADRPFRGRDVEGRDRSGPQNHAFRPNEPITASVPDQGRQDQPGAGDHAPRRQPPNRAYPQGRRTCP